jgi:hypothetical protein
MVKQFIVGFETGIETARMTTRRPSISVVYPVFNEEENMAFMSARGLSTEWP